MITVAIVTPLRFLETIQKVITDHDFDCAFRSYTYDSLTDIDEIYAECKDSCDIILFSGELGYHYMHRHYPDCPIPCFFTVYSIADVLSILLQFHLRHPEVALNRLYLDFLTPQNNYLNIQDYLPPEQLPYFFEEPVYDYAHITQRGNELWQAGKIDGEESTLYVRCKSAASDDNTSAFKFYLYIPTTGNTYLIDNMIDRSVAKKYNTFKLK